MRDEQILETKAMTEAEYIEETRAMEAESEAEYTEVKSLPAENVEFGDVPQRSGTAWAGRLLLLAGVVLAILFIFFMKQERAALGPEIEVMLLFMVLLGFYRSLYDTWSPWMIYGSYLCVLFGLLLVCARGLWSWLRKGCSLDWSTAHRLGVLAVGPSGKQSRYMIFLLIFGLMELAAMMTMIIMAERNLFIGLAAASGIFGIILSGLCFIRRVQEVDHLTEQIRRLHEGQEVSVREGVFAEDEKKLIDLNRQRDEAIQKAVISERFKVDLIANVSHDLRTPLTAILGYGELLEEEKLSPKGEQQLHELNRKAGYMRDLVESLFELTKVSSGVVESRKEDIDLIRLLEQTIGLFDDQLNKKQLQVRRHYEMDHLTVRTDGARMHQVFANLIGNAIKYTWPGTRIHLEVKEDEQSYMIRMINIASYEMDFEPDEIVQRFARGDKARTTKGSGLGLAIAQTYTESVGGTFQVAIDGEQFSAIVHLPKN